MKFSRNLLRVIGVLLCIPVVAIGALMVTSSNSDGPSAVFGGGPLVAPGIAPPPRKVILTVPPLPTLNSSWISMQPTCRSPPTKMQHVTL